MPLGADLLAAHQIGFADHADDLAAIVDHRQRN